jgi:hypothetical protein
MSVLDVGSMFWLEAEMALVVSESLVWPRYEESFDVDTLVPARRRLVVASRPIQDGRFTLRDDQDGLVTADAQICRVPIAVELCDLRGT